ncbi:MAG: hypothetical protein U9R01_04615 [candidate division WOR-3 bacterium]|nr:hypothetical protein [candidate division WOR-3 bacterium]
MRESKAKIKADRIIPLAFALLFVVALRAQEVNLKQKAIDEFKNKLSYSGDLLTIDLHKC